MVLLLRCPNCGKEVPPEEHFFCPSCGQSLLVNNSKKYGKVPIASGVLTISASVLAIVAGIFTIIEALATYGGFGYGFVDGTNIFFWTSGAFFIIVFSVGLVGSVFLLRKKNVVVPVLSNILLLISAAVLVGQSNFVIQLPDQAPYANSSYLYYAIPSFVLLIISILLIGVSRKEFKE